tara:strand:+ start:403 stop:846 length:444 start_codon:yes stop_codon:yes gene_type:complete
VREDKMAQTKREKAIHAKTKGSNSNVPSKLFKKMQNEFPNSSVGIGAGGHFYDALHDGDYDEAMYRADGDNLVLLKEIGIDDYLSKNSRNPYGDPSLSNKELEKLGYTAPYKEFQGRYNWAKGDVVKKTNSKNLAEWLDSKRGKGKQ